MKQHPLWYLMSEHFGTLTELKVHPSSPVLLTKNGPLEVDIVSVSSPKQLTALAHLKFGNRSRTKRPQYL